ncbi:MAG TPA: prephenate dehydratase [Solirubrobacteraceae bacterium]|nr:prephenate dehydratase [Solirubrobacteraceae bacterium]
MPVLPRVGYLGPEGTFSEEALLASASEQAVEPVALATLYDTVMAVRRGEVEWALVPIENSLDGSVTITLDVLAGEAEELQIVGEELLTVRHALIAREQLEPGEIETVLSHPQVPGQCTRFLRTELARAQVLPASSTAEAVRIVANGSARTTAALGTRLAAEIYGAVVIRADVQDRDDNETRFVWLARGSAEATGTGGGGGGGDHGESGGLDGARRPPLRTPPSGRWKTSLVFWGPGADSPGWLVRCLDEFARREINLTKIESRPRRERMGHYMFFVDFEGRLREDSVGNAIAGLRKLCQHAYVLGSYPAV